MPFESNILSKVHTYDILDRRADALNRSDILSEIQRLKPLSSACLRMSLSANAEVALTTLIDAEASSIQTEFSNISAVRGGSMPGYAAVGTRITSVHKLGGLNVRAIDEILARLDQQLRCAVQGMAKNEADLAAVKDIQRVIPELAEIAGCTASAIEERIRSREMIERREREAQEERQRERERTERAETARQRAEEERRRLVREREEAERVRLEAARRINPHQGKAPDGGPLYFHGGGFQGSGMTREECNSPLFRARVQQMNDWRRQGWRWDEQGNVRAVPNDGRTYTFQL
jgi:hypothetical protein